MLSKHLKGKIYTFEFTPFDFEVASFRSTCTHGICIKPFRQLCHVNIRIYHKFYPFRLHYIHTSVDNRFIQLKVWDTEAK